MHCPWLLKRDPKTTTMQNISNPFHLQENLEIANKIC